MEKQRFYNIDILRFIGAVIIVLFHFVTGLKFYYSMELTEISNLANKVSYGMFWVEFFFILSGFFLFYLTDFKIQFLDFFKKKILRLLPLVIFGILFYKILSYFNLLYFQKYINIYSLLLLNNVGLTAKNTMGNLHPAWFVSSLFWAMMFYFYLKQLVNEKWFNFITAILIFFSYTYLVNTTWHPPVVSQNFINTGMLRAIGGLGLGYFVCIFVKKCSYKCTSFLQKIIITICEGCLLIFCVQNTTIHKINFNNPTIMVLAFAVLITLFLVKQGFISQILNNKFSNFVGRYSYSTFIMHIIVFDLLKMNFWDKNITFLTEHLILNLTTSIILAVTLGIMTYHLIERPCAIYFKKRLESGIVVESNPFKRKFL